MGSPRHPEYGEVKYSTVYFQLDEPILFTCFFDKFPDKYVGIMVEDFTHNNVRVRSWYFVGVLQNELRTLEKIPGKLKDIFENRPVLWCNQNGNNFRWQKHKGISHMYEICSTATLS